MNMTVLYIVKRPTELIIQPALFEVANKVLNTYHAEGDSSFEETVEVREEPEWLTLLTERERKQVEFAQLYTKEFNHGTIGHNDLVLIAKLVDIINQDLIPAIE